MKTVKEKKVKKVSNNHLGPVENLEIHLQPDWWKRIFNSMYLKTDADVVDDKAITESEVEYFGEVLELKSGDIILDLACGQGRHTIELARKGFINVHGLDRSRYLIQKAKQTISAEGLFVNFKEGDALEDELASFVKAVTQRESPEVTAQMGREALKIALNIMDQIKAKSDRFLDL